MQSTTAHVVASATECRLFGTQRDVAKLRRLCPRSRAFCCKTVDSLQLWNSKLHHLASLQKLLSQSVERRVLIGVVALREQRAANHPENLCRSRHCHVAALCVFQEA